MPKFSVLNFQHWIDENRHLLKPPVGNKVVYQDTDDFIIMVVGGPNARKDYHYNETEEFFYMLEGDMTLKIQENGQPKDVHIQEGEIFLLPPKVPHSPQRTAGSIGLVIERKRNASHTDGMMWFCGNCNHKLYEEYFPLENIETQLKTVMEKFYADESLRTCSNCGTVMEVPSKAKA
ncbi:MAG: 3-hydroxyanthranilate 3,4-dioxygenase [Bacteroidota bacterium]